MKDLLGIHAIKRSAHIITNSEYLKHQTSSKYDISQSNIWVRYCGVDDVFFNASITEARRRVKARFGVENYLLTFATGDNGSSYSVSLERNFQIRGLQKGKDFIFVEFIPLQRRSELADLYAAARRILYGAPRGTILHLAGWGHPLLVAALLIGRLRGLHVFVETDTATGQALSGWKKFVKRSVYPSLFRLADHFLPAGTRQAAYLASYGVPKHKITIAQMTVDVAAIQHYVARHGEAARASMRAQLGVSDEVKVVLYMGRLEPYKGASDLLDAFADLASRRADVRLVIAGSGSLRALVRGAAAAHPHIAYLGRLSGDKVLDAYIASDIVVAPSRYEGWGLVVNEAMACGRPIVATDRVGCVDDLVTHGETGLLVPAEAPHALADALELLASDDRLREKMGAAATRKIAPWTLQNEAKIVAHSWDARCNEGIDWRSPLRTSEAPQRAG